MRAIRTLQSTDDLEALLELSQSKPVMVLKHSTRCPTSSRAHGEFLMYAAGAARRGVECAIVLVVEGRPVSLALAERVGVVHQSPQAILIKGGRAVWHESHESISADALARAEG